MSDHDDGGQDHHGHDHDAHHAHDAESVGVGVVTISSSRSLAGDESGDTIVDLLEEAGHTAVARELVVDERGPIESAVEELLAAPAVEAIITNGGTGAAPDDVTVPTIRPLFDRELPGFGERFRARSADDIGPRAMLSRATAGLSDGVPIFCLPGSQAAVRLGVSELIVPTLGHIVGLAGQSE
jgi:molybdenum cofactor biosynthesis protein B